MQKSNSRHKQKVCLTIEPTLLKLAREAELNLSAILAAALKQQLRMIAIERWKANNKAGLQELNRVTEELGLFSDNCRIF
ncbi:type II toxin-antitoxin system CcdA family antitoxin [Pluralibacter gergoviae]|uniref:type II toxin-antitoxin system CcdA family antitoxin n=1 Tax=Pluralibacter gergoviae TaxID=61647 RepID=UPI00090826D7|nr:type II toxin-antitoxin system CcdA family antitoxin [Pluralibacter gergoviae]